ncbi:MAG: retropepsin-like aspartic protease [Negativicutes bacterium]|nr:retropepsin-like aspartic protease [Negativicutes bacterium]
MLTLLKVAGSEPVPVFFDTGSSENILDLKLAAKLGLPNLGPSTAIDGSLGKPIPGFLTEVKGATLGDLSIDDGPANAVDYDLPTEKGVFGPNCFPGKLVQMDLGIGSILVMAKTAATVPLGAGIPYIGKGDDALPSVIVDFGTLQIAAELDTGNNAALLFPLSFTNQLTLEDRPKKVGEAGSVAGRQPLFRARLKGSLKIGPLTLDRPVMMFIEGGQPNVGLPIARQLVVVFDPSARRSWLISSRSPPKLKVTVMAIALAFGAITAGIFIHRKLRKDSDGTSPPTSA